MTTLNRGQILLNRYVFAEAGGVDRAAASQ
jgi:hypothetical protein